MLTAQIFFELFLITFKQLKLMCNGTYKQGLKALVVLAGPLQLHSLQSKNLCFDNTPSFWATSFDNLDCLTAIFPPEV